MKIVLGGAQLADSYGISNQKNFIPKKELEYVIKNCKSDIIVETPGGLEEQKKDIAWIQRRLKK